MQAGRPRRPRQTPHARSRLSRKSPRERAEAAEVIKSVVNRCKIEAIAIGNGTASRETETFVRALGLPPSVMIVVVNEAGASIYSASDVAREEFPDLDLTVRGSISIGRRLMDPLAELVKIDPKSIGVGQYQHDVDQAALKRSLDDTVVSCVNHVGVELNTASTNLLAYVSGLNSRTALNIVQHRNQNGPFKSREELLKVAGLGPKAFEQAAGFLRIRNGLHPSTPAPSIRNAIPLWIVWLRISVVPCPSYCKIRPPGLNQTREIRHAGSGTPHAPGYRQRNSQAGSRSPQAI